MSDPRVFFAAERTLLAWVRTGLTMIALGFVVARFSLFIRLVSGMQHEAVGPQAQGLANILGIALVCMGSVSILLAMFNHWRYVRTLPPEDVPTLPMSWLSVLFSLGVAVVGLLLAVYLLVS